MNFQLPAGYSNPVGYSIIQYKIEIPTPKLTGYSNISGYSIKQYKINSQFPVGYSNLSGYSIMQYKNEFPIPYWLFKPGWIFGNAL